ncbi:hypothetical protein [Rahnella victoriana]|nr:hypothetical protein [Rahnella victoriana]
MHDNTLRPFLGAPEGNARFYALKLILLSLCIAHVANTLLVI